MIKGSKPYTFVGTPEPGSGQRIVPMAELLAMTNDPKFREAVDRIEKHDFNGGPSQLKYQLYKMAVHDRVAKRREDHNKKVIELALAKKKSKEKIG